MKIYSQQNGAALVVSLIILVSLTMLGLTAIQRTTTDLSMAGNQRETGLMFQSAEIGLTTAENYTLVDMSSATADFDGSTGGYLNVKEKERDATYLGPDYFSDVAWAVAPVAPTDLQNEFGVKEEPRYMIEYLGERSDNPLATVNVGAGYGGGPPVKISSIYRTTARGTGVTGNSYRYVQSYVGRDFNDEE